MAEALLDGRLDIKIGDSRDLLREMPGGSVNCCVTSPPYFGLRDYGHDGQIGLEPTPDEFVAALVEVFREVRRVLAGDGTVWLNLGDSYGAKKQLGGIPWRVAFALQADGWYLRQDIIWHKPNPMPECVRDRCTKAHEYVFLLSKSARYWYDAEAVAEPGTNRPPGNTKPTKGGRALIEGDGHFRTAGALHDIGARETRNRRSVWSITSQPYDGAHFATMPPKLAETCILAGCPKGGVVLDPFGGAGTTAIAALRHGRRAILCELNPEYADLAEQRIRDEWRVPSRPDVVDFGPLYGGIA